MADEAQLVGARRASWWGLDGAVVAWGRSAACTGAALGRAGHVRLESTTRQTTMVVCIDVQKARGLLARHEAQFFSTTRARHDMD
jgi:hypothetical protein